MRFVWFVFALTLSLARAADSVEVTNRISIGVPGTLEMLTPVGWSLVRTNLHMPYDPPSYELHAPSNTTVIRLTIYWDGFVMHGKALTPTEPEMAQTVSNVVVRQYLPISVEKTFDLEKLRGPHVTGWFARLTDAGWTPVVKDEYHNLATGMYRCGNLWGDFNLLANDKNGPQYEAGMKVMQSLNRTP